MMTENLSRVVFGLGLTLVFAGCQVADWFSESNAPRGLTAEYRENPCGIDVAAPRLGWKLAPGRDVAQAAYRVVVASTREKLARDEGDLWDSGRVESARNVGVAYAGAPLATSRRAFWKVKTWSAAGEESAWSTPAEWTMGVMRPADWTAKWIGPAACTRPDEDFGAAQWITAPVNKKGMVLLEYSFDFDGAKPGEFVEMVHAGVSQHDINVNGRPFNRWSGHIHDWRYLRFRDMTPWLVKGRNKIEVRVFPDKPCGAKEPIDPIRHHAPKGVRAFLAKIILPDGRTLVTGKEGWTSPDGAVAELGSVRAPAWGKDMVLRAENASPAFAKSFTIKKPVASAVLHVTGVGFYEASLNGGKIGEKVLDPSPTAFDHRVLYSTYRLDQSLRQGENELRILVGHGWYDMRAVATWNFETSPWRDFPRCIAQLEVVYADGTREVIATDRSWRQVKSPLGHDDVFEGEVIGAWNPRMPDLEKTVVRAEEVPAPRGRLVSEAQPGAQIMRTFRAKRVQPVGEGAYVIDFGENVAGWARLTLRGQRKGDVVSIRYDERVNEDGTPAAASVRDGLNDFEFSNELKAAGPGLECRKIDVHFRYTASQRACAVDAAFQTDRFICAGAAVETYEPRFAYNGFRYAVVKGLRRALRPEDAVACVIHTAFPTIGSFACSDETFNTLMKMGDGAYRSNFTDGVPTDCPHREKNGWTGDASIASELAQYLYENTAGYEKWLRDILDAQLADGNIPGIVPTSGWGYHWGNGPAWDSALPVVAWNLWIFRGDRRILDEVYPALVKYLDYTGKKAAANGLVWHGLGDWVPVNRAHMPSTELTSSCYYHQALVIAGRIAALKGLKDDAAKYAQLAARTREGINKKFYKGDGVYDNGGQTAQAFPLAFGIVPEAERAKVEAKLVEAVTRTDCHVDMGLLGTKHVFRALSRAGRTDLAFKMITNPTKPSPVEWIQKGGTTLWEDWGDGSSRNHIMFGDFVGWAYQYLAGIRPIEAEGSCSAVTIATKPAFAEIVLAPQPIAALDWARARVDGPNGEIASAWKRTEKGIVYSFVVPPNTMATICLPGESPKRVGSGSYEYTVKR
ncbi:MAG: family 78 glycoside hydrolase catalytic domain [Kiritimatiellia bacterium]